MEDTQYFHFIDMGPTAKISLNFVKVCEKDTSSFSQFLFECLRHNLKSHFVSFRTNSQSSSTQNCLETWMTHKWLYFEKQHWHGRRFSLTWKLSCGETNRTWTFYLLNLLDSFIYTIGVPHLIVLFSTFYLHVNFAQEYQFSSILRHSHCSLFPFSII